tara:strand:- start:2448 stop:4019 length:1572 start_codon:yes stop_codon:yes gene_type:complete
MALLGYPDHLLDEQGNPKPGVTGPSPASMGLLSAGLGMLSTPTYSRLPGDMSGIGQGAMQGLQAYQERLNQIQQQRKDYNQSLMQAQNQEMAKQRFGLEMGEAKRLEDRRKQMVSQLPNLLEQMRSLPLTGIEQKIASIQAQANAGDIAGAYQAATGILQQKLPSTEKLSYNQIPGTDSVLVSQGNEYKTVVPLSGTTKKFKSSLIGEEASKFLTKNFPNYKIPEGQQPIVKLNQDGELQDVKFLKTEENFDEKKLGWLQTMADRWEKNPSVQNLQTQVDLYRQMEAWATEPSGPGDVAMIFSFMKSLDPRSTVRDTEYQTAAQAGLNIPESLFQMWKKAEAGQLLTPTQRLEFIKVAKQAVIANKSALDSHIDKQIKLGKAIGINEDIIRQAVTRDPTSGLVLDKPKTETPPPPKVTEVPEPGPVEDDNAANIAAEVAAGLDLGPKKPKKLKREVRRNNAGRAYEVQVLPGDGASKILQAAGIKYSEENIKALIRANKKRFNKNRELVSSGGFLLIPKAIRQ